ncbi:hypothetical protein Q2941_05985 [Bradyrhizobium sp. UFLA05-153]
MIHPQFDTIRRAGTFAAALAALALHTACAAEPPERPFDPPVGSRWIIETETSTDEARAEGGTRNSLLKSRAEMTFDAKVADGFRITYVHRGTTAEGNDPTLPLVRSVAKALDDVPIKVTTDVHGRPVRVDNLDEAKAAVRRMAGSLTEPYKDKPQLVALLNQIMAGFVEVDADKAATSYVEDLPQLAKAQVTGMKRGEVRRSTDTVDSPLGGGAMKSNASFELTEADAATGKRTYVNTTSYDAAALKEFTQSLMKKLMAAAGNSATPQQIDDIVKQMVLSLDERAVLEVEDGMTRKITDKSVTSARALGRSMQKTEVRTITVTPAQ